MRSEIPIPTYALLAVPNSAGNSRPPTLYRNWLKKPFSAPSKTEVSGGGGENVAELIGRPPPLLVSIDWTAARLLGTLEWVRAFLCLIGQRESHRSPAIVGLAVKSAPRLPPLVVRRSALLCDWRSTPALEAGEGHCRRCWARHGGLQGVQNSSPQERWPDRPATLVSN